MTDILVTPTVVDIVVSAVPTTINNYGSGAAYEQNFTQASLNVANQLIVNHNQGSALPDVVVYDASGSEIYADKVSIFNTNTVIIDMDGYYPLIGTYKVKIQP